MAAVCPELELALGYIDELNTSNNEDNRISK